MRTLNRLLIANRGEIAVRIARSARQLGITTIAVCSDADRDSLHVRACDSYVELGGVTPAESYLRIDKIIEAARTANAHAIHPGYGFLSENSAFACAVEAAELIFVGPPAAAIHAMGDKARARQRMAEVGIPVIPGYDGDEQEEEKLLAQASRLGLPLMVKAAAGGGGRGMRLVTDLAQLPAALRSASSESLKAFGDGRLILERALIEPRHVEIQVLADSHGSVLHLGERDCSVQRRHQKIIEESPSPALTPQLREAMGATAVAVAREIGYVGAGTVEFLLDSSGSFFFMEMNTRLQVEHPVTELVTGLDLVELQLRIARGEGVGLTQANIRLQGHAIEVRICAEEPADDFMPRSGTVIDWSVDPLVRCDHAIFRGLQVTPWYDSMLAKMIAHGTTRAEAVDRLTHALDSTSILGVPTNRAFLARILRSGEFVDGSAVSTAFIQRNFASAESRIHIPDTRIWALAAWLSVAGAPEAQWTSSVWRHWSNSKSWPIRWRLSWIAPQSLAESQSAPRKGRVRVAKQLAVVESDTGEVSLRGAAVEPATLGQVEIEGLGIAYRYTWDSTVLWVHTSLGDYAFRCGRREPSISRSDGGAGVGEVRAAINGRVVEVSVTTGSTVARGERLMTIEAMKMEHEVRATRTGTVTAISARAGDQVAPGQLLARLEGD